MIMAILEFRAKVCALYQKFQYAIDLIFKFFVSFFVLKILNSVIGYNPKLCQTYIVGALSILCAFTPAAFLAFVCLALTVIHVYAVNQVLAVFVAVILVVLYCFFLRFSPKHAYIMIAMPIMEMFGIPCFVPLMAGLTTAPVTIFPMACGIFFKYLLDVTKDSVSIMVDLTNLDTDNLLLLVLKIVDDLFKRKEMLYLMALYAAVELVVFIIRVLKFNFSFEISIFMGVAVNILGNLLFASKLKTGVPTGKMVMFSIIAGLLVMLIYSFIRILDYTAVERVQFEDDDYYYYVRAVPKIKTALPKLKVRSLDSESYFEASMANEDFEYVDDPYTDPETGEVLKPEMVSKKYAKKMAKADRKSPFAGIKAFFAKLFTKKEKQENKKESKVVFADDDDESEEVTEFPEETGNEEIDGEAPSSDDFDDDDDDDDDIK